jgi:hypothetical protein
MKIKPNNISVWSPQFQHTLSLLEMGQLKRREMMYLLALKKDDVPPFQ